MLIGAAKFPDYRILTDFVAVLSRHQKSFVKLNENHVMCKTL